MQLVFQPYRVPFRQPLVTAHETHRERMGYWVEVWDAEGRYGFGEVAPLPAFGSESHAQAEAELERLQVQGLAAPNEWSLEGIATALQQSGVAIAEMPALHAGIELALLDAHTRHVGIPLAKFLGVSPQPQLSIQRLLRGATCEDLKQETLDAVREGYGTFKLKIGAESFPADAKRINYVRSSLEAHHVLRLDANGSYIRKQADFIIEYFGKEGIDFVEQPISSKLISEYEALRGLGIHIAADEALLDHELATALIRSHSVDVLILKPTLLGGLGRCVALAREAAKQQIRCVVTSSLERQLGVAAALHLAAALPPEAAGLGTLDLLESDDERALPIERGKMTVPTAPGLGLMPPEAERPSRPL